jgi:hypothetical protein
MGHTHLDGAHTHGPSSGSVLDGLAQVIAVIALGVAAIDVVMWVLHILVLIATGIGFLVLGTGAGYAAVRYQRFKNRRLQSWTQGYPLQPDPRHSAYWQPPPPALPPSGDVHLHLPPGMTGNDLAQIMRAQHRPLPGPGRWDRGDGW